MKIDFDEFQKFKIIRPLFEKFERIEGIPIIKKDVFNIDWNMVNVINLKNLKSVNDKNHTIFECFNYDKVLDSIWNNPFKHLISYKECLAIATPDFSIYPQIDSLIVKMNIYKSRWIGCFWQQYGIKVVPTIQWCDESTFDISFRTIERNSIVIISTLGCHQDSKYFLKGYNYMMDIINPEIVICVGGLIDGMFGKIMPINLNETFCPKLKNYTQLKLFDLDNLIFIERRS